MGSDGSVFTMTIYLDSDEIVMVPVPRSQLNAVYRVLANPAGRQDEPATLEETVLIHGQGPWTESMVSKLEADLEIPAVRGLITLIAERAPKPLTFEEAVGELRVEAKLLRAQIGSLTKTAKRLFGARTWPMSVRYGEAGDA